MAVWKIWAGEKGENEEFALNNGVYSVEDPGVHQSVEDFRDVKALKEFCKPSSHAKADALWRFAHQMKVGEMVVLRYRKAKEVAIGEIVGEYVHCPDEDYAPLPHTRRVKWLVKQMPKDELCKDRDIQKSFDGIRGNVRRVGQSNPDTYTCIKKAIDRHLTCP